MRALFTKYIYLHMNEMRSNFDGKGCKKLKKRRRKKTKTKRRKTRIITRIAYDQTRPNGYKTTQHSTIIFLFGLFLLFFIPQEEEEGIKNILCACCWMHLKHSFLSQRGRFSNYDLITHKKRIFTRLNSFAWQIANHLLTWARARIFRRFYIGWTGGAEQKKNKNLVVIRPLLHRITSIDIIHLSIQ